MRVSTADACDKLHTRYLEILDQLAGLPAGGSVSEKGRSLSVSAAELEKQLEVITKQAAALGCPVGRINEPAVIISRARA